MEREAGGLGELRSNGVHSSKMIVDVAVGVRPPERLVHEIFDPLYLVDLVSVDVELRGDIPPGINKLNKVSVMNPDGAQYVAHDGSRRMVSYDCPAHSAGKGPLAGVPTIDLCACLGTSRLVSRTWLYHDRTILVFPGFCEKRPVPPVTLRDVRKKRGGGSGRRPRSSARAGSSSAVSGESRRMSTIVEDGAVLSSEPRRRPSRRVSLLKTLRFHPCPHHLRIQPGTGSRIPTASTTTNYTTAMYNSSAMCP